jgi:hypothetical protein
MPASNNFSSVKTYRNEMPKQAPVHPDRPDRRNVFRMIIAVLVVILLVLLGVNFLDSPAARVLSGRGSVQGQVVDEHGQPASARVIIFGADLSTTTGQDGTFTLSGVPAGSQTLVVAYHISAVEIPITVVPGQDINVGQVQFKVTAAP